MIRTVRIPALRQRMRGDTPSITESITYIASTCTSRDPLTGLCIGDVFSSDMGGGDAPGSGGGLPGDPGIDAAVQAFASSTTNAATQAALNAGVSPSSLLAQSLTSGNPNAIPGPGLGLVTLPDTLQTILKWAAAGLVVFLIFGQQQAGFRRSRS